MRHSLPWAALCVAAIAWAAPLAADPAAPPAAAAAPAAPAVGSSFQDCPNCPEMVVIPAGSFMMGQDGESREMPVHKVTLAAPFAMGKSEVTFDQWEACTQDGGCGGLYPGDAGFGRENRPVVGVSWNDAQSYVQWLSRKTGKSYRLPSEAEWEYAARGGTTTKYYWGDDIGAGNANCENCGSIFDSKKTAPVCSFPKNPFGLCDMAGNVVQWVEDRWNATYGGAPEDGSAREDGDLRRRVMRGGSWFNGRRYLYPAYRNGDAPTVRNGKLGFRVARSL